MGGDVAENNEEEPHCVKSHTRTRALARTHTHAYARTRAHSTRTLARTALNDTVGVAAPGMSVTPVRDTDWAEATYAWMPSSTLSPTKLTDAAVSLLASQMAHESVNAKVTVSPANSPDSFTAGQPLDTHCAMRWSYLLRVSE